MLLPNFAPNQLHNKIETKIIADDILSISLPFTFNHQMSETSIKARYGKVLKSIKLTNNLKSKYAKVISRYFKATGETASFSELYRYASRRQKLLAAFGVLVAFLNGIPMPVMLIIYGQTTDDFIVTQFCDAFDYYNVSQLCPPDVTAANINQQFFKCNWTDTNITIPEFANTVSRNSLIFTAIGIIFWLLSWMQTSILAHCCEQIVLDVRLKLFQSILLKPVSWYDKNDSGAINSHFSDTMNKYKQGIGDKVGLVSQSILTTIVSIVIILVIDWRTALVVFSLSPVFIASSAYLTLLSMGSSGVEMKSYQKASSIAQQVFSNIRTVHAFNGLDTVQQQYESHLNTAKVKSVHKGIFNGSMLACLWFVLFVSNTLAFWYGSLRINDGITIGAILIVIFGMQTAVFGLGGALPHYHAIIEAKSAAGILFSIMDGNIDNNNSIMTILGRPKSTFFDEPKSLLDYNEDEKSWSSNKKPIPNQNSLIDNFKSIKFQNVYFTYPSRPDVGILDNVSFEIAQGNTVAIVGESGSGKSTVAQLLMGFYNLRSGSITIDEYNLDLIDIRLLRSKIGLVSQEPVLFSTTIEENVRLGKPDATDDEIRNACQIANAHEFISKFPLQYKTEVGQKGSQLSGGQKQRIAIARALISNPKILLLDEATSALDSESEKQVQIALDTACRGRTTIIIAHRLSTIRNADIIIGMNAGKVMEIGTHEELMQQQDGVYKALVNAQSIQSDTVSENESDEDEFNDLTNFAAELDNKEIHVRSRTSTLIKPLRSSIIDVADSAFSDEDIAKTTPTKSVLAYIFKMNYPEIVYIISGSIACIGFGVCQVIFEFYFAKILFVYAHCDDLERQRIINRDCLRFLWIGIAISACQLISSSTFVFSGAKLTKRLRQNVFRSIVNREIAFFDKDENSVGKLCTLLSNEASAVQGATGIRIGTMLSGLSILLVGVVIAFVVGWQLSLVILAFVPVLIFAGILSMKVMAGFDSGDKVHLESTGRIIIESTSNIRLVKQLRQENYFYQKFKEHVDQVCQRNLKRAIITGFLFGFSQGSVFFAIAATYYAGSIFIDKGYMTSEDLMLVFGTLLFGAMAVGQSQAMAPDFGKALDAAKKIYAVLETKTLIDSRSEEGVHMDDFKGQINFVNVKFSYPNRKKVKILKNVTMKLNENEKVALVGSSGCGKSTIIQLIQRFYDPTHGQILIDGINLKEVNLPSYRRHFGIVSQEPILFDWSIAKNIAFGATDRNVSMHEIESAAKAANIHSFIVKLPEGYDTPVGDKGSLMKQHPH
ncbi:hypothetical protein GJ496_009361 [Pomphorhynchus laevis]|nr:hypothetical protein GJ496_009361 [Pomphorhynchus laevis]